MVIMLIIGLPGSGKTYLAEKCYVPEGYALIDDPTDLGAVKAVVQGCLLTNTPVVITDPHLCDAWHRGAAIGHLQKMVPDTVRIEAVYFENDPDKAAANIKRRNRPGAPINVYQLSRGYTIPEGAEVMPIWEPQVVYGRECAFCGIPLGPIDKWQTEVCDMCRSTSF